MMRYIVKPVVSDYGLFENGELKLICSSRRNALLIKAIMEKDDRYQSGFHGNPFFDSHDFDGFISNIQKEKGEIKEANPKKERLIESDEDCADCLCRVCARNSCNDSYNVQLENGYANCSCNCKIGDKLIETEDDCPKFIPDED